MLIDMLTSTAAKHGDADHSPPHREPSPQANAAPSFFSHSPLSMLTSVLRKPPQARDPSPSNAPNHAAATAATAAAAATTTSAVSASSPTFSRPPSLSSAASTDDKPKKKAPRPKTTYRLAQPPSAARPKLHFRPKVLLQLHQVVSSGRPKPVYEVIPFSLLAPRSTRRLARTFSSKSRDKLCPNDLLIVKAEEYGAPDEDSKSDDERWGGREVIGIICPAKEDRDAAIKTEVLMNDGACWEVTNLPNGGYEFTCTDEHGLTLKSRWVPKAVSRRTSGISASASVSSPITDERKFNFSTISANSRRHPVIASMTRANIEVLDSYAMPSATSPPTPGYPPSGLATPLPTPVSISNASSFLDYPGERLTVKTDDTLRRFIVLSGIWVAFSEGWSPLASLSKSIGPSPLVTSTTFRPAAPGRSMSYIDSPRSASPASTIDETRRGIPRIFRTGTQRLRNVSSQTMSPPASAQTSPTSSPRIANRSRRSNSTGNADLNSKTGSTRKKFGLALEDQALEETEEERQIKRSTEIMRIKELVLPNSPHASGSPRIVESPAEMRSPALLYADPRPSKTQSAYNPVTTAGLWDSGVTEHPGLKARPTSLVILNGKKEKAKRKQEKEKIKEKRKSLDVDSDGTRKVGRFRQCVNGIFRRGKN